MTELYMWCNVIILYIYLRTSDYVRRRRLRTPSRKAALGLIGTLIEKSVTFNFFL